MARRLFRTPDVLVVGAGPAGMATALAVAANSELSVLVLDKGATIEERVSNRDVTSRYVSGIGGAGLFSDGKLCLDLGVGGDLSTRVSPAEADRLVQTVYGMYGGKQGLLEVRDPTELLPNAETKSNPVAHLGTDRAHNVVRHIAGELRAHGVEVLDRTEIQSVERDSGEFVVRARRGPRRYAISATNVVLAMGKVGASQQEQLLRRLQISADPRPMYIGVRVETATSAVRKLFKPHSDNKYKIHYSDGSTVKTHCVAVGGEVLSLSYDGLPLAGGHSTSNAQGSRTSFSILWNGFRYGGLAYDAAAQIMARGKAGTDRMSLATQSLDSLRAGRLSSQAEIERAKPTAAYWHSADISHILPTEFFVPFWDLIKALASVSPNIMGDSTLLYAPSIEWWMSRTDVTGNQETAVPGLYSIGDGSGWSQGIVHAAATGILAAEGILGRTVNATSIAAPPAAELRSGTR
jgi:uncharacterized FAD-dependent dehydrogenase